MLKPIIKNGDITSNFTFHIANNKDADQTVLMCRLVCAFVVRKYQS